jgi:hypothetical protein
MAGTSRQHRGEKRRKELARKAKQEEKRQRKTDRAGEAGGGPPIDWGEMNTLPPGGSETGLPVEPEAESETTPVDSQGPKTT